MDLFGCRNIAIAATVLACLGSATANAQQGGAVESMSITGLSADEFVGTIASGDDRDILINIEACRELLDDLTDDITVQYTIASTGFDQSEQYTVKLANGTETCATQSLTDSGDTCQILRNTTVLSSNVAVAFSVDELVGEFLTTPDDCYDQSLGQVNSVILVMEETTLTGTTTVAPDKLNFTVALSRPSIPADISVAAGETSVEVSWDEVSDAESYEVYVTSDVDRLSVTYPEMSAASGKSASGTQLDVDGLTVDTTYYVAVVAVDSDGNRSLFSAATEFVTVPSNDFWEVYRGEGGVEAGGCAVSANPATGAGLLFALFGLVALRRRRALPVAALFAVFATLTVPSTASADMVYDNDSRITGAFELKLGVYRPNIDEAFPEPGPYERTFGDRTPLLIEGEYSRQFYRGVGSLGASISLGWMQTSGDAIADDGTATNDQTRLRILPFRAGLVYRFDYLQERWNVPFSIALKAGLDYYAWFVRNEEGIADTVDPSGERTVGRGGTTGFHVAAGAYLLLDFLAPRMASEFDANTGVNNTYFFAEVTMAKVDDFGGSSSWDLSDTTVMFGLAFEF